MSIVPKLQEAALKLPLPAVAKSFLSHPAGPFTSKSIHHFIAVTRGYQSRFSLLLGPYFQVDDHLLEHWWLEQACRVDLSQPANRHLPDWSDLDALLICRHSHQLQPRHCERLYGRICGLLALQKNVSASFTGTLSYWLCDCFVLQASASWERRILGHPKEELSSEVCLSGDSLNRI